MKEKLRVGIVGLGKGSHHLALYQAHPRVEVVALADPNAELLEKTAREGAVAHTYPSAEEMLAAQRLDLVSVCTPNKFHHPITLAALEAGCHVLCEKPMAMSAVEAREMLTRAREVNRRLMINFSYRFTPQSRALKAQVETGILGEIYFARSIWHRRFNLPRFGGWFGIKELSGGGPVIDLGVHRLDLALWLMGYPKPKWVLAATYDPIAGRLARETGARFDVEDLGVATIRFENGATLILEASWAAHQKEQQKMETTLYGTEGGLVQRNLDGGYSRYEAELYFDRAGCPCDMRIEPAPEMNESPVEHFVNAILNETPHIATAEEGVLVMEILDAIYESARLGRPVEVQDVLG